MPEISRFYGIIVYMYFDDHNPPHFHVEYSEYDAMIEIESGDILRGSLPAKQLKYIQVWSDIHKTELLENFMSMRSDNKLYKKITPLT